MKVQAESILGVTKNNALGDLLGTGFREFESPVGIYGLYLIIDRMLCLLAVIATKPQTGQFRTFIHEAKQQFEAIQIEEVFNPILNDILARYGFTKEDESWIWRKP